MGEAADLLGVSFEQETSCSLPSSAGCYVGVERGYFDTILGEPLELRVGYGVATQVATAEGEFTFYAAEFRETGTREELCSDGRGLSWGGTVLVIRR